MERLEKNDTRMRKTELRICVIKLSGYSASSRTWLLLKMVSDALLNLPLWWLYRTLILNRFKALMDCDTEISHLTKRSDPFLGFQALFWGWLSCPRSYPRLQSHGLLPRLLPPSPLQRHPCRQALGAPCGSCSVGQTSANMSISSRTPLSCTAKAFVKAIGGGGGLDTGPCLGQHVDGIEDEDLFGEAACRSLATVSLHVGQDAPGQLWTVEPWNLQG